MSVPQPIKVTRWRCPFCSFVRAHKTADGLKRHIEHCIKNPERTPHIGELSSLRTEPWRDTETPWWPGLGMIYTRRGWRHVPGYQYRPEPHGPGLEAWPRNAAGTPLDDMKPRSRLCCWEDCQPDEPTQGRG